MQARYKAIKINGHQFLEHRLVMELALGRELRSDEQVHHINHNKRDNRFANLKLVSPAEHGLEHTTHPMEKSCVVCGSVFVPHKTKRQRQQTCSLDCKRRLLTSLNKTRKLSEEQVRQIKERRRAGAKLRVLAEEYGVTEATISQIARGVSRG